MKNDFPRILTLLRKERNISQKAAAEKLGISQALLSHYEKGIRECGLDFVIAVADEYGVSTDYLLGRTSDRQGVQLVAEDIPEYDDSNDKNFNGSVVATLNKKLIVNTVSIVFDQLRSPKLKDLTTEISAYLSLALYKVFHILYCANSKNPQAMFAVRKGLSTGLCNAAMQVSEAYMTTLCAGDAIGDYIPVTPEIAPEMSPEQLSSRYQQTSASLFNLISTAEARMGAKPKK